MPPLVSGWLTCGVVVACVVTNEYLRRFKERHVQGIELPRKENLVKHVVV